MSWKLIDDIRAKCDLRPILPFGLALRLGDVVGIQRDGGLTLEGSSRSLLGLGAGRIRLAEGGGIDLMRQSGDEARYAFKAAGAASTLFPELPAAKAGFDISFGSADTWLLAAVGRRITSLEEINRFRTPILDAYAAGVWKADWALVVTIATVERMTLLASSSADTEVALSLNADVAADASMEMRMTANASLVAANKQLLKCIIDEPTAAFCGLLRVRDGWWRGPYTETLDSTGTKGDPALAADADFWNSADSRP